jgi:DNA ligase 1
MRFVLVAECFSRIESIAGRKDMAAELSALFSSCSPEEARALAYIAQGIVAPPWHNLDTGSGDRTIIESLSHAFGYSEKIVEREYATLGDLGLVAEKLCAKRVQSSLSAQELDFKYVYFAIVRMCKTSGAGSHSSKVSLLSELMNSASPLEAKFIARLAAGKLRLGIGESTIIDAISRSCKNCEDPDRAKAYRAQLERAYNLSSDLGYLAQEFVKSPDSAAQFGITLFLPVRPALAERASSPKEIISRLKVCAVEGKFDGFRMQIHKKGKKVEIFSRKLELITESYPDIVRSAASIPVDECIFEGEAIGRDEKADRFYSFQETMRRRRKHGIDAMSREVPLSVYVFDIMFMEGRDITPLPYSERRDALEKIFPHGLFSVSEKKIAGSEEELSKMFRKAEEEGLEGLMAKDLNAPYTAGARKFAWIKLKKSYGESQDTVDAVVVGYYLGKGQRADFNFGGMLAAVLDDSRGILQTVARVGSGYSEDEMRAFAETFSKSKIKSPPANLEWKAEPDFWVEPKTVIEIAFDSITQSPVHTCAERNGRGYALRFPRMIRVRDDKGVADCTTSSEVESMFLGAQKKP